MASRERYRRIIAESDVDCPRERAPQQVRQVTSHVLSGMSPTTGGGPVLVRNP